MNLLLTKLEEDHNLIASVNKCVREIRPVLPRFLTNFPGFTDHSIEHSKTVLDRASDLLGKSIAKLNIDEIYILTMACYLHDIGMCPSEGAVKKLRKSTQYKEYFELTSKDVVDYVREIHHQLSYKFIVENHQNLGIINVRYAQAVALVARGHRQEELLDFQTFNPKYPVRAGSDFVCLPFLAGTLRIADELDITNDRTPDLLYDKYLPTSRISKQEWAKHKANYLVNFSDNRIIVTAVCSKIELYRILQKQYCKIEETLRYVQKVIRQVPVQDRTLGLEFNHLEKNVETKGFVPRDIGFSFDFQNTFNTFIGKHLYSDKSVAVREALQNSIDTCRLKKQSDSSFCPQITVCLRDNKLVFEDNGLGMDEFVVEKYFARLASSFYAQKAVSDQFESISEFGIGILTYFLLCDFFEVETKTENKASLKFRVTINADESFFFYDNLQRKKAGTKITLFLKEPLSFDELRRWIDYYIRFVDFPILVKSGSRREIYKAQQLIINEKEELSKRLNILNLDKLDRLAVLDSCIDTQEYSGVCGLLLMKDKTSGLVPGSLWEVIGHPHREDHIDISQKGIFIAQTQSKNLRRLFGKINLKKRNTLGLNRSYFANPDLLTSVIADFEVDIIKQLFARWEELPSARKVCLTRDFVREYVFGGIVGFPQTLADTFIDSFTIQFYREGKVINQGLKSFLKRNNRFVLVQGLYDREKRKYEFRDLEKTFLEFKVPLLMVHDDIDDRFYIYLFERKLTIKSTETESFYVVNRDMERDFKMYSKDVETFWDRVRRDCMPFEDGYVSAYPGIDTRRAFNSGHPLMKFMMQKEAEIKSDHRLASSFEILFEILDNLTFNLRMPSTMDAKPELKAINKILNHINNIMKFEIKLTKKDFPVWEQKKF